MNLTSGSFLIVHWAPTFPVNSRLLSVNASVQWKKKETQEKTFPNLSRIGKRGHGNCSSWPSTRIRWGRIDSFAHAGLRHRSMQMHEARGRSALGFSSVSTLSELDRRGVSELPVPQGETRRRVAFNFLNLALLLYTYLLLTYQGFWSTPMESAKWREYPLEWASEWRGLKGWNVRCKLTKTLVWDTCSRTAYVRDVDRRWTDDLVLRPGWRGPANVPRTRTTPRYVYYGHLVLKIFSATFIGFKEECSRLISIGAVACRLNDWLDVFWIIFRPRLIKYS